MDSKACSKEPTQRSFREIPDNAFQGTVDIAAETRRSLSGEFGWDTLLVSRRILIVSEAGAGKTYECRTQQARLWDAGEPAFFLDLAQLAREDVRDLMSDEEGARFNSWLASQSDVASIFLDSIDELKLSLGSFETALRRLSKALAGQLGRVRIVVTTRPVPFDLDLIRRWLRIPVDVTSAPTARAFADLAMGVHREEVKKSPDIPAWRTVALLPLSDPQIREMAARQGVVDADALLADIQRRNAEDFARRPQDLIELCVDWRDHRRIRTHREQVEYNIRIKLKPRTDRLEKAQLSHDRALEGASRLALATLLTRKTTLRHSAEADRRARGGPALDPYAVLSDWSAQERETLLERALFGFASYGRVRFHHRSVMEFLAAQHLLVLLTRGMTLKAVRRLLFATTSANVRVVRPSMRPVAAWLSLSQPRIFSELRDLEPEVLLLHGDPESLTPVQRADALRSFVARYGSGSWRGMSVPKVQIDRFAAPDLADAVIDLWTGGIENAEVRELLMELIVAVPMSQGADIAFAVVMKAASELGERMEAADALLRLNDARVETVAASMETDPALWPDRLVRALIPKLFPAHLPVGRLCRLLSRLTHARYSVDSLGWLWVPLIAEARLPRPYLAELRDRLSELVTRDIQWQAQNRVIATPRPDLLMPLETACLRLFKEEGWSTATVHAAVLALQLSRYEHGQANEETTTRLRACMDELPAKAREVAFWFADELNQRTHHEDDARRRFFEILDCVAIDLDAVRDGPWILEYVGHTAHPQAERAVMLEAALHFGAGGSGGRQEFLQKLRDLVGDRASFVHRVNEALQPSQPDSQWAEMLRKRSRNKEAEERRALAAHSSWMAFWAEVAEHPDVAFDRDRAKGTVWNLWRAMSRSGRESQVSGWNRRFIEQHFGTAVADRMRVAMAGIWRSDRPTLRSERSPEERDQGQVSWRLGLAAIAAEAEDPDWAKSLSVDEAMLAARYVPVEGNGFPFWFAELVNAQPAAVDAVLGRELTHELREAAPADAYSMLLQNVSYADSVVAVLFMPRVRQWFDAHAEPLLGPSDPPRPLGRLRTVVDLLLREGDFEIRARIRDVAMRQLAWSLEPPGNALWLPTLMRLDPAIASTMLEEQLREVTPSATGAAVEWIGTLFGDRHSHMPVPLAAPGFTPSVLLTLVRLAYRHVRPSDDAHHEGVYSPDSRDRAESGRSALLSTLLESKGPEGWAAKVALAEDPALAHFRDRALTVAREKAAEEADDTALTEVNIVALERRLEASPVTRDDMFALLVDRLDDLDDLLLSDESPRAAWAGIADEKIMRRELARALRTSANHAYVVDQETVTADEKETDLRLLATASDQQAVIELKLGDWRSARDLSDTIRHQLVTKYMAADNRRCGCLLVTVARDRPWHHPVSGQSLSLRELEALLRSEASQVEAEMRDALRLVVKVLDLRPRLGTESARKAQIVP